MKWQKNFITQVFCLIGNTGKIQVLLVNKNIVNSEKVKHSYPYTNALDKPDNPGLPDCQIDWKLDF